MIRGEGLPVRGPFHILCAQGKEERDIEHLDKAGNERARGPGDPCLKQGSKDQAHCVIAQQPDDGAHQFLLHGHFGRKTDKPALQDPAGQERNAVSDALERVIGHFGAVDNQFPLCVIVRGIGLQGGVQRAGSAQPHVRDGLQPTASAAASAT